MNVKLSFLGAARQVTGSKYLLEVDGHRLLIDCGMYQEWKLKTRNWQPLPVPPDSIDAVLLTHAHLDHSGWLPRAVNQGFKGPIYCTNATAALAQIVLLDSAKLQAEDTEFKRRRHQREGRQVDHPVVPLYDEEDVKQTLPLFRRVGLDRPVEVAPGVRATFFEAGHILGSTMIQVEVTSGNQQRTLLFSGDVGRWDKPILNDPTSFAEADYVIVESTYGDRLHSDGGELLDLFANVINDTNQRGGNVVIPSFAIGRTQELLYYLNELLHGDRIPNLAVFIDSPMAIRVNDVFTRHAELFDDETKKLLAEQLSPFEIPTLKLCRSAGESKAINHIRGTAIIIAGSGMCTGGRIKHHLEHNITRPESTVLFVGFQASDTLGGNIQAGTQVVRINGQEFRVRARIETLHGFSAHADRDELMRWLGSLQRPPRQVFVTHGEDKTAQSFASHLAERKGWRALAPKLDETVELS
ncbi:MAG: MBL fold metallo-hydrolase [Deltaproteobacteria bacterium]|nr:MBL fold metallo-hydrolase [Deltaproteobacteria bacterium]